MTPPAAASGRPPPASQRIKSEQQFPPEPWSLVTSNKKKEKWHVFFFSLSPVNSSSPPKLCRWPHQLQLCPPELATRPSFSSQGITSGAEPRYLGRAHLEGTVSGNARVLWPPLTLIDAAKGQGSFLPWTIAPSCSKGFAGESSEVRVSLWDNFHFSYLHSWVIAELTLHMILVFWIHSAGVCCIVWQGPGWQGLLRC